MESDHAKAKRIVLSAVRDPQWYVTGAPRAFLLLLLQAEGLTEYHHLDNAVRALKLEPAERGYLAASIHTPTTLVHRKPGRPRARALHIASLATWVNDQLPCDMATLLADGQSAGHLRSHVFEALAVLNPTIPALTENDDTDW